MFLATLTKDDFMRLFRRECFLNYALNGMDRDLDEDNLATSASPRFYR